MNSRVNRFAALAGIARRLFLIALCALSLTPQARASSLLVGYASISPTQTSTWVAKEQGFFSRYAGDTEIIFLGSGTRAAQALLSGNIPVALMAGQSAIAARARAGDLIIVAGIVNRMDFLFVSNPAVRKPEDLKGKRIAVSQFGSASHHAVLLALKRWHLDPVTDRITVVQIGGQPARLAALEAKAADATVLSPGYGGELQGKNHNVLANLAKLGIPYPQMSVVTTESFLAANEKVLEGVLKALVAANAFVLNAKNKETVMKVLSKYLKVSRADQLEEHYRVALEVIERKPFPSSDALASVIQLTGATDPEVAKLRPENVMQRGLLERLDRSGFIDQQQRSN
jgi:ABC-type nitrate/sulfonate/bicarbonate transport system substrate-binding protein